MLLNKMTQLTHPLAAYKTGLIGPFTLAYSSRRDLITSLTWPHTIEMRMRTTAGTMSTMSARPHEIDTFAAAQNNHASTLSLTNLR